MNITQEQHDQWLAAIDVCPTEEKFKRLHDNIQKALNSNLSLWYSRGSVKRRKINARKWLSKCVILVEEPLEVYISPSESTTEATTEYGYKAVSVSGELTFLTYDDLIRKFALADLVIDTGLVTQGYSLKTVK